MGHEKLAYRETNHGVSDILHLKKLDDLLDVVKLLLLRYGAGLAKKRAELQRFPNSRGWEVQILLLNVTGLALLGG